MGKAKKIILRPIDSKRARIFICKTHYSKRAGSNSQLNIGVFLNGFLEGVLQYGPSLCKANMTGLVKGTGWNEFIELNRMAFTDKLPRNSESRAISVSLKMIKKYKPKIKWVVSFADACQCGDGTIYRASGFSLIKTKKNTSIFEMQGEKFTDVGFRTSAKMQNRIIHKVTVTGGKHILGSGSASMKRFIEAGAKVLPGFQLCYIYFLHAREKENLSLPIIPYSEINKRGVGMHKGKKRAGSIGNDAAAPTEKGGVTPTPALH